jgi:hypothetical protein
VDVLSEEPRDVDVDLVAARAVAEDFEACGLLGGFGDADDEAIAAGEQDGSALSANGGKRAVETRWAEVCAVDFDFASGERGVGEHGFDAGVGRWLGS